MVHCAASTRGVLARSYLELLTRPDAPPARKRPVVGFLGALAGGRSLGWLLAGAANLALEDALVAELALGSVLETVAAPLGFCLAGGAGDAAALAFGLALEREASPFGGLPLTNA